MLALSLGAAALHAGACEPQMRLWGQRRQRPLHSAPLRGEGVLGDRSSARRGRADSEREEGSGSRSAVMSCVLDVADPQVLLHFPEDPDGFHYHRRVLLCRAGAGGVWVTLTPDLELAVHDLTHCPHHIVAGAGKLTSDLVDRSYIFDPISKAELEEHRRRARIQARILVSGGDPTGALETRWLIAGPSSGRIGEVVPRDIVADE